MLRQIHPNVVARNPGRLCLGRRYAHVRHLRRRVRHTRNDQCTIPTTADAIEQRVRHGETCLRDSAIVCLAVGTNAGRRRMQKRLPSAPSSRSVRIRKGGGSYCRAASCKARRTRSVSAAVSPAASRAPVTALRNARRKSACGRHFSHCSRCISISCMRSSVSSRSR